MKVQITKKLNVMILIVTMATLAIVVGCTPSTTPTSTQSQPN
jgi:hypothetical protein